MDRREIVELPLPQISEDSVEIVDVPFPQVDVLEALQSQVRVISPEVRGRSPIPESGQKEFRTVTQELSHFEQLDGYSDGGGAGSFR